MVKRSEGKDLLQTVIGNAKKENPIIAERDRMLKQGLKIFPARKDLKRGLR